MSTEIDELEGAKMDHGEALAAEHTGENGELFDGAGPPDDPEADLPPADLLAIWDYHNATEPRQQALVADRWSLWRLARDLQNALRGEAQPHERRD